MRFLRVLESWVAIGSSLACRSRPACPRAWLASLHGLQVIGLVLLTFGASGCVIPPPEAEESLNQPPFIDWSLTQPSADEILRSRSSHSRTNPFVLQFRIDEALEDLDGDLVNIIWYWIADDGIPIFWYGDETMSITPCELRTLSTAERLAVKVLVSNGEMVWTGDPNAASPVEVEEGFPVAKRIWVVHLLGDCPPE